MDELAQDINAACRALGVPSGWCVKKRDETSLKLDVEGECWGYRFVELKGGFYVAYADGKDRRWKMRKTVIDRLSRRIHQMYLARDLERRRASRVAEVQGLLAKLAGLHEGHSNLFWVNHSDCRLWVYSDHISVESRNFGLYLSIPSGPGELDAVIEGSVLKVIAAVERIVAEVKRAEDEFKLISGQPAEEAA